MIDAPSCLKEDARKLQLRAALPQLPASALGYWSVADAALGPLP